MTQTYRAVIAGTPYAANKSLLTIFNGTGSGRILRVKRVWQLNNQTVAVTGVLTTMELRRVSASSGGTAGSAVKLDTANETLPAQVAISTGATDTLTGDPAFMRFMYSNDEPSVSSLTSDETETIPALACVFDTTGDTDIQSIVLRESEGLSVRHTGSTTVGIADVIVEFTMAST